MNSLKLNACRITFPLPTGDADTVSGGRMGAGTVTGWSCVGAVLCATLSHSGCPLPISLGFIPGLKGVTNFAGVFLAGMLCDVSAIDPCFVGVLKPAAPLANPLARADRTEATAGPLVGVLARA